MRTFAITVNGNTYEVQVEELAQGAVAAPVAPVVQAAPVVVAAPKAAAPAPKPAAAKPIAGGTSVPAPMPGTILSVNVQPGQEIKAGQVLVILEAMKMENEIPAPRAGKVAQVLVSKGSTVNSGDPLVVLE